MRVVLQLREHLVAVELGHQDVEQQQVEPLLPQQVERLARRARRRRRCAPAARGRGRAGAGSPGCRRRSRIVPGAERIAHAGASGRSAASASLERPYSCSIRSTSSRGVRRARRPWRAARASRQSSANSVGARASRRSTSACAPPAAAPRRLSLVERAAERREQRRRVREERVDHLGEEVVAAELPQALERGGVEADVARPLGAAVAVGDAAARASAPPRAPRRRIGFAT